MAVMGELVKGQWALSEFDLESLRSYMPYKEQYLQGSDYLSDMPERPTQGFEAERFVLYTSLATVFGHASVIFRTLARLERDVAICLVDAHEGPKGWAFLHTDRGTNDTINGFDHVYQLYQRHSHLYDGEARLPLIWDRELGKVVSNDPIEILHFLNLDFIDLEETMDVKDYFGLGGNESMDQWQDLLIKQLMPAFSACAFPEGQESYEENCRRVFEILDKLDNHLENSQHLGETQTWLDWILFCILIRFDAVYFDLYRCNLKTLSDYKYLSSFVRDLYQEKHIGATVNVKHIKEHYYKSYRHLNPDGIVPMSSEINFDYLSTDGGLF